MSKPSWDALTEQLRDDPSPKTRRKACALLAATRDPAVIPFLKNAYVQDEDEQVRDAARDALAAFKAMHAGKTVRRLPVSDRVLSMILGVLVVLFVILLGIRAAGSLIGGDDDEPAADESWRNTTPTNRNDLVVRIQGRFDEMRQLSAQLRQEVQNYNNAGQVACPLSYALPEAVRLSPMDNYTYPDLEIVGANLDASLLSLQKALIFLNSACAAPATQMEKVIQVSTELDNVDFQLNKVSTLLQEAINNPAPTVGPTITPLPTLTFTPPPTATPAPATATLAGSVTPEPSITPQATETPTITPQPTTTLPFPALDYPALLREISKTYVIIGDLKNNYGTGMVDQWQKAAAGGQDNANYCTLPAWPTAAFALSADQIAQLTNGVTGDPQLEEAVRLQAEGLDLANQARTLYERDCTALALANSAAQGLDLAQRAYDSLTQSQTLHNEIRKRSQ